MDRLQQGEDLALNEIMRRWQQPVANFIFRSLGSEADALDLAQETFIRVYQSRERYRSTAKFSTWLFTIASNLARDRVRWRTRHATVPLDDHPGVALLPAAGDAGSEPMEAAERALAVREAIQTLPEDQRTTVLLFEFEDMNHKEIGSVMGCSTKSVEARLYRARETLRKRLSQWLVPLDDSFPDKKPKNI
jgi:RNA polymerase sigma-70 factor (ECF subfamily)